VALTEDPTGLCLAVEDDGVGLPDGFDAAASAGLGMRLVAGFAQNLTGVLEIERLCPGSRFTIRFPR
jgi:two-component sensor histidine kinase